MRRTEENTVRRDSTKRGGTARKSEDTRGVHLWLILWKAARSVEAHAQENIYSLGMCYSDFAVLEALLHKGAMPVNTIGKKILLTSGSITAAVDRLERRGLVARVDDAGDRRARIVHLTARGRRLIEKAFADHEATLERAVDVLSPRERTTLIRLLKKVGKDAVVKSERVRREADSGSSRIRTRDSGSPWMKQKNRKEER